jgi:TonB family protein
VEQSLGLGHLPLIHSFTGSPIHKRITLIQRANDLPASRNLWKKGLSILLAAGICYLQACQPKEAEPTLTREFDPENTYWLAGTGTAAKSSRFNEGEHEYGHYPKAEVDEYAYPVGGFNTFRNYIQENLRETHAIKPAGLFKKAFVQFTVDKEGNVRNPRILEGMGLGPGFDEEAIRLIVNGPKWVPARKNGRPVEASMMEAIIFGQKAGYAAFASLGHKKYDRIRSAAETDGPVPLKGVDNLIGKLTVSYPEEARKQQVEGIVVVGFTVQADGKATNFEVVQPVHPALDREALRAAQAANVPWKPAAKNGKAQASKVLISSGFFLTD